jgi:hypothetical protein
MLGNLVQQVIKVLFLKQENKALLIHNKGTVHRLRDGKAVLLICQPLLHMPKQLRVSFGMTKQVSVLHNSSESLC